MDGKFEMPDGLEHTSMRLSVFGTWTYEIDRDRFRADDVARQILGLDAAGEALTSTAVLARFHSQHRASLARMLRGDFTESVLLTVRLVSDDSLPKFINIRAHAGSDAQGGRVLDGLLFESSGGMQMREQIVSSNSRFDALAAAIPNAFMYMTPDLVVQFASAALGREVRKPVEQMIGRHVRDVLGPEEFERHAAVLHRAVDGLASQYEATVRGQSGAPRYLRISTGPVCDDDGAVIGVVSEATDVTDLRVLEANARRGEAAFRMLAEGVPNHLLFLNRDLHIEFANDAFLEAAGWTRDEATGKHMREVLGEERFQQRLEHYERALAGESFAYENAGAAGSDRGYFRFMYRPGYDSEGRICGLFSMAIDISDRHRAELALEAKQRELERSNKDLEQFAYVASHDLKSPLRAMEQLVEWIMESLKGHDDPEVHGHLALLAKRTLRLNRLLDDLLDYSRAGRKVGEYRQVDARALVEDIIELCGPPEHVRVEIIGALPVLETYPAPLEQVLRNLIGNAIKHYKGNDGRISISCEESGVHYVFAVEDNGEGIPPEYAEKVFEMFQTLQPRDKVEGSGMGLSIVKRIVEWQGGRVWFETPPSGTGAVFKFQWTKRLIPQARRVSNA